MTEKYHRWYSPNLNMDVEMLVFGDRGYPVILFPTTKGRYYQNKDFGLIDSAKWFIDQGLVKIYCPDTFDWLTWYNKAVHPAERAKNYSRYDKMLLDELAPWAMHETGVNSVATAGCSFGGYHAANFAFKHPGKVRHLFAMGGAFDIKMFTDGYYDNNIYYNNPVDFLPGNNNPELWKMNIILGTGDNDICKGYNMQLSGILNAKNMKHWLDIRPNANHDWPVWKQMFPHYLSAIK